MTTRENGIKGDDKVVFKTQGKSMRKLVKLGP